MGSRAQVLIEDTGVYLFTHNHGYELVTRLREALGSPSARRRWGHPEYLTRIIFEHMLIDAQDPELGYGIGTTEHGDNMFDPIVINCKEHSVTLPIIGVMSFEAFADK